MEDIYPLFKPENIEALNKAIRERNLDKHFMSCAILAYINIRGLSARRIPALDLAIAVRYIERLDSQMLITIYFALPKIYERMIIIEANNKDKINKKISSMPKLALESLVLEDHMYKASEYNGLILDNWVKTCLGKTGHVIHGLQVKNAIGISSWATMASNVSKAKLGIRGYKRLAKATTTEIAVPRVILVIKRNIKNGRINMDKDRANRIYKALELYQQEILPNKEIAEKLIIVLTQIIKTLKPIMSQLEYKSMDNTIIGLRLLAAQDQIDYDF